MSEIQVEETLQQFIEQSTTLKEAYIKNVKEKLELLKSWDIAEGDRLHKIQKVHLLHSWCALVLNNWKKWLMDVNRVATFSEEETEDVLKFFYELSVCVLTFELVFSDVKMSEDIDKMHEGLKVNSKGKLKGVKHPYVV